MDEASRKHTLVNKVQISVSTNVVWVGGKIIVRKHLFCIYKHNLMYVDSGNVRLHIIFVQTQITRPWITIHHYYSYSHTFRMYYMIPKNYTYIIY